MRPATPAAGTFVPVGGAPQSSKVLVQRGLEPVMDAHEFLAYLGEHTTTHDLAAEVADLLAARRERRIRAATKLAAATHAADRVAS
jgi:hypothetical protein